MIYFFMDRNLQIVTTVLALLVTIIGTTVAIDARYAKSQEVQSQLEDYYRKGLKLKILEIDLKKDQTPEDRALRQYLIQEMEKVR